MAAGEIRIRPFRATDYPDEARIRLEFDPVWSLPAEELQRREVAFFPPPQFLYKLVAERSPGGTVVGVGRLATDPESYDPRSLWIHVVVERRAQGHGVGRALADALRVEAGRRHAGKLWSEVMADDPHAVRIVLAQGFEEKRRAWRSRLRISDAADPPDRTVELQRSGISFLTAAELDLGDARVVRDLYELNSKVSADEPRLGIFTPITLPQFVALDLDGPSFLPDAYFLARTKDELVAVSTLKRSPSEPDALIQAFTGTVREFRGMGIATELKRRGTAYARTHGFRSIVTGNDSLNQPMLAINRRLGYQPEVTRISSELRLGP